MLITGEYREQNRQLHSNPAYGTSGKRYAETVRGLADALKTRDILDYGCGKGTLQDALGWDIHEYDPCIKGKDADPEPADLVVCTDVLEHIEPDLIDDVLDDIKRVTTRYLFASVAVTPAVKTLPDGRNAHILLRPFDWWAQKLGDRFEWISYTNQGRMFTAVMVSK